MSETREQPPEVTREQEKQLRLEVGMIHDARIESLYELKDKIKTTQREGRLDTVILREFALDMGLVMDEIDKLQAIAEENRMDLIVGGNNGRRIGEDGFTWCDLQEQFKDSGINAEALGPDRPGDFIPESVVLFFRGDGTKYAFPKFPQNESSVHKIPGTKVGVTICGEINHIKAEDLEGLQVLYNPAEEADDVDLYFRQAQKEKGEPLTRDEVIRLAMMKELFQTLMLSEEDFRNFRIERNRDVEESIGKEKYEELFGDEPLIDEDETPEARQLKFDSHIDEIMNNLQSDGYDSIYVQQAKGLSDGLKKNKIPVVRADGLLNSGVLNEFEGMKIDKLTVNPDFTRLEISV